MDSWQQIRSRSLARIQQQRRGTMDSKPSAVSSSLLSPHVLRLLKLIQQGDHAHSSSAVSLLVKQAAESSPLQLWEILGRLQAFLSDEQWQARVQASQALQAVARLLPVVDQRQFLSAKEDDEALTIADLLEHLGLVLEQGQPLWSSAETAMEDNNDDEEEINNVDTLEERVQRQRQVLARRLGLSTMAAIIDHNATASVEALLTKDDLVTQRRQDHVERIKKRQRVEEHESVRVLLVLAMQQSEPTVGGAVSHQTPQRLLASELVYRMFHARWHVRHGAVIGCLSLLRAWRPSSATFGAWAEDLLARALAVLALDRFGDFSGASSSTTGSVVAPVRESAGQLVSILWIMAHSDVQCTTMKILRSFLNEDVWEVRHAALIVYRFLVSVLSARADDDTAVPDGGTTEVLATIVVEALQCLEDSSDDVRGVSAQVLNEYVSRWPTLSPMTWDMPSRLWSALCDAKSYSSCLVDLVELFSAFVKLDCARLIQSLGDSHGDDIVEKIAGRLTVWLDSDFVSVKQAALRCIQSLAEPFANYMETLPAEKKRFQSAVETFIALVKRLFEAFFDVSFSYDDTSDGGAPYIKASRDSAWAAVAGVTDRALLRSSLELKYLLSDLIVRYFGVAATAPLPLPTDDLFDLRVGAAEALSHILGSPAGAPGRTVMIAIECFLQSPWASQCEAACVLLQVCHSRLVVSDSFRNNLHSMLSEKGANCLRLGSHADLVDESGKLWMQCGEEFRSQFRLFASGAGYDATIKSMARIWLDGLSSEGCALTPTAPLGGSVMSMRVNACIAGSIVALGLPPKLTPVVRALMTSLKNEVMPFGKCSSRLQLTCRNVSKLLLVIQHREESSKARNKIVGSVCDMAVEEVQNYSSEMPGTSVLREVVGAAISLESLKKMHPLWGRLEPVIAPRASHDPHELLNAIKLFTIVAKALEDKIDIFLAVLLGSLPSLVALACENQHEEVRVSCTDSLKAVCSIGCVALKVSFESLLLQLADSAPPGTRQRASSLLAGLIIHAGSRVSTFVRSLLPVVMSLMTDPVEECARSANRAFAALVETAPLAQGLQPTALMTAVRQDADSVIDHLILGKPLPPFDLPKSVADSLAFTGIEMRPYQKEGVAWLAFLQSLRLNGALCDSMGLGKTLQALVGIALAHGGQPTCKSLIICPATVVGHWMAEIEKYFSDQGLFRPLALVGDSLSRSATWNAMETNINTVVTSYAVLRSDIGRLETQSWRYCVLDEGHLLKNPKTATARASRRITARHRLLLSGTPVQNSVDELWATFDFLMPNFLGSSSSFAKDFARPIARSQLPGASAEAIGEGLEKLKTLHQQVLPFILRREKEQVLQELPPKIESIVRIPMTALQSNIYQAFCANSKVKDSLAKLQSAIENEQPVENANGGGDVLKSLLFLRLLCTHPSLVISHEDGGSGEYSSFDSSGKLMALADLLRSAGIDSSSTVAADNDPSLLFCEDDNDDEEQNGYGAVVASADDGERRLEINSSQGRNKCLIFAQFKRSLDAIEDLLFKPHMPGLRYLRLDGDVPAGSRASVASLFNDDPDITVLLATTRVGGLGLNLTGADTVIFVESDLNPFWDKQASDRAHRIGQRRVVSVYTLVTEDSIEERILDLQRRKVAVSEAIVNTDNSTMYSMGTDRLLDIFTFRSNQETHHGNEDGMSFDLDALVERCGDDYASLTVDQFLKSLK